METKPFEESSVVEQEQILWTAAQDYIRGDIEVDRFEDIERPFSQSFRRANLAPPKRKYDNTLFILLLVFFIVANLVLLFAFLYTKNQFLAVIPAPLVYFLYKIVGDYSSFSRSTKKRGRPS